MSRSCRWDRKIRDIEGVDKIRDIEGVDTGAKVVT